MMRNIWALVLALLATCVPAPCGTYFSRVTGQTWATNSTWSTASCGGVAAGAFPGAGDTATICTGHTVTMADNAAIGNNNATDLTIQAGGILAQNAVTFTISGGVSLVGTWTAAAGATITPSGARLITYQGTTTPATFTLNGTAGNPVTITGDASNYFRITESSASQVINFTCTYCNVWLGGGGAVAWTSDGGGNTQHIEFTNCLCKFQTRFNYSAVNYPSVSSTFKFTNSDIRLPAGLTIWLVMGTNSATNFNFNANTHGMWNTTIEGSSSGSGTTLTVQFGTGATSQYVLSNVVSENIDYAFKSPASASGLGSYVHLAPLSGNSLIAQARSGTIAVSSSAFYGDYANTHHFQVLGTSGQTVTFSSNFSQGNDANGAENHYLPDDLSGANATVTLSNNITKGGNAVVSRNATSGSLTINHHTHWCANADCDALLIAEATPPTLSPWVLQNSLLNTVGNTSGGSPSNCAANTSAICPLVSGAVATVVASYLDFNAFWNVAGAGSEYTPSVSVSGKSYGQVGFGSVSLRADPRLVNGGADFATWSTQLGGAGTVADAFANLMCMNGYDRSANACTPNASYSVAGFLSYIQAAYAPKNTALKGAANDGGDIGAIPVLGTARRASVTWR